MTDDTQKVVLTAWQNKKQEIITHPIIQEKLVWGLVPYVQAMLLARYLTNNQLSKKMWLEPKKKPSSGRRNNQSTAPVCIIQNTR